MKILKNKLFVFLIISFVLCSIIVIAYLNPQIDNEDFDLGFRVANSEKSYDEERNRSIDEKLYTFNHQFYFNQLNNTRLTIHSLDIANGTESIIFLKEDITEEKKFKYPAIDYKNKKGVFSNFNIRYKADSIFIFYNLGWCFWEVSGWSFEKK